MRHLLSKEQFNLAGEEEVKEISVERLQDNTCELRLSAGTRSETINLEPQELSDFIGLMLHVQSSMKRFKKY
tara:strand:- start:6015 stop:6230 length:216 start_codon:yes stop_codon:yes gene_type:complete